MYLVDVKIKGVKPFLFHKFNIECLQDTQKPKSGSIGNDPYEWMNTFFHDQNKLYMPGTYMMSTLNNGSVHTKVGRGTLKKTWMSAIQIDNEKIYFNRSIPEGWEEWKVEDFILDSSKDVYIDVRMVQNPNTKGRNVRYRLAMSPGWECEFSLICDPSLLSKENIEKVIRDTGKMQGIADGRTLGYGRYQVEDIKFSNMD